MDGGSQLITARRTTAQDARFYTWSDPDSLGGLRNHRKPDLMEILTLMS